MENVGILGFGKYVPERVMTNADWEKLVDTSDEWITTRTGIKERRYAVDGQGTSDLAAEAAKKALADANLNPEDIELIILATCTPDYRVQNCSSLVQKKIGAVNAACFDIQAACSGFIYSLTVGRSLIQTGMYKKILVIGAESVSRLLDMTDRNTAILFGDGACAAVMGEVEEGYGIISSYMGTEGVDDGTLRIKAGGTMYPATVERVLNKEIYLEMNGTDVFKFAVKALPFATKEAAKKGNVDLSTIDILFPHQANLRIIEAAAKRLRIPMEKVYLNIHKYGNTSAASIGLAIGDALEEGRLKKGDLIALTGFGAGLTYGSLIMRWSK
ncbi:MULTISPECIES: beta-ketoacyl-ACP synthase III [Fusobacterium]|uniref:beta-ketoacyl-ACP synthase III n=1 Tax=Fusobacterium TaxID=848 RepID=UPI002A74C99C|nr:MULTISPECIES: beta-ketoacyl-ACP synthase III [Fusobacterium]MCF2612081.1 ketoacyl-ACP synthase III [Fusobacterium perfoetens]MDY2981383.1 beta-ketoacyl-ACP synthase III [Fusobacterium sp.]